MKSRSAFGWVKRRLFGTEERPHRVWTGAFRGLTMNLDPNSMSQYILGLHEREAQGWLRRLCDGANSAVDIGTAAGEYTLYFLMRTGVKAVYTFDPDDVTRRQFRANLELNGLTGDPRLVESTRYVRGGEGPDAVTLDSLLPRLDPPCVVKVDVDGGEADILAGAKNLLATGRVRWLIETHSVELERECVAVLTAANHRVTVVPNAWWRVIVPEQRPIPHNRWLVAFPK